MSAGRAVIELLKAEQVRHVFGIVGATFLDVLYDDKRVEYINERYVGADIGNPRFDRLAELFGARGYYVEHPDQIGDIVRAALACGKPAVIEIPIDPNEFPVPATTPRRRR